MMMHIITNYTANAGAEAMLSRLLRVSTEPAVVVSLIDISDSHRSSAEGSVRCVPLLVRSIAGAQGYPNAVTEARSYGRLAIAIEVGLSSAPRRRLDESRSPPQIARHVASVLNERFPDEVT